MELPSDIITYIKSFLPPHILEEQIKSWSRKKYFYKWYFEKMSSQKQIQKIKRFVHDNDFWIKMSGLSNEGSVKLKHKCHLDKKRMNSKLDEMKIRLGRCQIITHIPRLNKHGNYSEVFHNGEEIIY